MVSSRHEAAHRIFQDRPELLAPVFRILDLPPPEKAAVEVLTPDVTEARPLERRVDSVLRVKPYDGGGFLLAIEAQGRCDPDKAVNWAYYVSYLAAKYKHPVLLLVVCQDKATADWAAGPFRLGMDDWTTLSVHPLVLGPGNVPVILDPEEAAQDLTLATFSALTHGSHRDAPAILKALARAMGTADPDSVRYSGEPRAYCASWKSGASRPWQRPATASPTAPTSTLWTAGSTARSPSPPPMTGEPRAYCASWKSGASRPWQRPATASPTAPTSTPWTAGSTAPSPSPPPMNSSRRRSRASRPPGGASAGQGPGPPAGVADAAGGGGVGGVVSWTLTHICGANLRPTPRSRLPAP